MSLPRYNFSRKVEPELLHFLKVANEQKSKSNKCDFGAFEVWDKLLPLDPELVKKLHVGCEDEEIPVIDLCSDEVPASPLPEEQTEFETEEKSTVSDIAFVIKENLQTQCDLSVTAKEHLLKCCVNDLDILFEMLEKTLNNEEVYYLGLALQGITSNILITPFCHYLLGLKVRKEYCDKLMNLLQQLSTKHLLVLQEECFLILQQLTSEDINIFLQYMKKLSVQFQATLVRKFILSIQKLDENSLTIISSLLNNEVEYDALNKFVEMLSNVADDHTRDKDFGKLIVNVTEALGPNLVTLEQPLKHIIAGHKSVWKSKLQKTFTTCYEDSLMFSQSFRD